MALERWFARRRKSKVLELADRQMTLAIDTVIELEKSINAASNNRKKKAMVSFKKLSVIEHCSPQYHQLMLLMVHC